MDVELLVYINGSTVISGCSEKPSKDFYAIIRIFLSSVFSYTRHQVVKGDRVAQLVHI